jgi:hypothetical protein
MRLRVVAVSLAALGGLSLAVNLPPAQAVGPELLPNVGFEQGTNPAPPAQGVNQPLLPTGWAFEGAAGLFDHTANEHHAGQYAAGISIPASGKRKLCVGTHPESPAPGTVPRPPAVPGAPENVCGDLAATGTAKDTAAEKAYTVMAAWRPVIAVRVVPGVLYNVSGFYKWTLATQNEGGALVRVRWLDANGVSLGMATAFTRKAVTPTESNGVPWTSFLGQVRPPAGAVQAVPLFGAHDDVFLTQVVYDDVSFRTA